MDFDIFLRCTEIVDFDDAAVAAKARELAKGCGGDVQIAEKVFLFVRDEIRHAGDYKDNITTCTASDVLKYGTGWCYAKSILFAALLRANDIPAGFCYQRLSCSEYVPDVFCLHGLNAIHLKDHGWYKIDARGNKKGVDAQFDPPHEKLAFELGDGEMELPKIYDEPLGVVVEALQNNKTYEAMINNFPDIKEGFCL
jgi:transglutaminase-like putative cysteine protease